MKPPACMSWNISVHSRLTIPIILLVVVLGTRFGGFFSLPPSNISAFWPVNALLFSFVFLLPARRGRMTLLLALPAYAAAELWIGYPLRNAIVYGFANVAEVAVLLWLLKQTTTCSLAFDCLKDLFALLPLALLAAPVGGAIGAMEATQAGGDFWAVFLRWSLADFFGYCLCVPLALTWRQWRQAFAFGSPVRVMEFAVLLMVLLSLSLFSSGVRFLGVSAPLGAQFLPLPVLLWAALRFGPPGGAIATVIVACVAFFSATHGVGLFAAGAPEENVASLQLFFAALVISVMTIASLNAERKKSFDALREEVAERKQAEKALQKSEALLNTTQRLTKVGGWEYDVKSGNSFWTEELYRIHEIPKDPGMDHVKESLACYAPKDRQIIQDAWQRACEQGESYDLELPFTTYTGKSLWIRTTVQPVYEEGKVVRLVGNLVDITERKEAEEELRRLTLLQQTILKSAAYSIVASTPDGIITGFNPAAERLLGYTAAEVVGKQTPVIWHDPQEIRQYALRLSKELDEKIPSGFDVFTARPKRNLPEEREWIFIRKDGTRVPVNLSVTALRDDGGHIIGFVGMINDITERKRAEEEIRQLNQELDQRVKDRTAQLEASNKELEAFAYSISHDLRTPLRAIDGFSRILLESYHDKLDEEGRDSLRRVRAASQRMGVLIDDLLALSRIIRGEIRRQTVDLSGMATGIIAELRKAEPERRVDFVCKEGLTARGDAHLIQIMMENLLGNAWKYTGRQPAAKIEFGMTQQEGETVCFVRDNGAGFDMAFVDKLFGAFQRLHSAAEFPGTGIGLATVQRIIRRHGGRIWAESVPGQGATFYFTLPAIGLEAHDQGA